MLARAGAAAIYFIYELLWLESHVLQRDKHEEGVCVRIRVRCSACDLRNTQERKERSSRNKDQARLKEWVKVEDGRMGSTTVIA